jgi:phosphoribosylformylglycinamidine cyclo-ligase
MTQDSNQHPPESMSYGSSGVDIHKADIVKAKILKALESTLDSRTMGVGSFGSLFHFAGYKDPVLVSSCDGVGTKLKIAALMNRHTTVGRDIVNHCINDILCNGAMPLFFMDYIASAQLDQSQVADIVTGLAEACRESGVALIGGETAEMPGFYNPGVYDLVGFVVGVVEHADVLDGSRIMDGDVLIGLTSSGLHTNGYSLARRVFNIDQDPSQLQRWIPELDRTLGDALLEPHRPYHRLLQPWLRRLHGLAHITGGGFGGNVQRILPDGLCARINRGAWDAPAIFKLIGETGHVDTDEMYRVFNMGIGIVAIASKETATELVDAVPDACIIGTISRQTGAERVILI